MPKGIYQHKKGYKLSEEAKEKISLALAGKKLSKKHKQALRIPFKPTDYYILDKKGCWNSILSPVGGGYSRKYDVDKKKYVFTHRYFYEKFRGKIPEGLQVDHLCKNTKCINPDHLEPVTMLENIKRSSIFKIPQNEIEKIKNQYKIGITQRQIAIEYEVTQSQISRIVNNLCRVLI